MLARRRRPGVGVGRTVAPAAGDARIAFVRGARGRRRLPHAVQAPPAPRRDRVRRRVGRGAVAARSSASPAGRQPDEGDDGAGGGHGYAAAGPRSGPRAAVRTTGRKLGVFKAGKTVPVEALLSAALITSANDAAVALAHHMGGSVRGFARLMNERARVLGLHCTRFVSPHGLERGNRSCAADLAAMTRLAMADAADRPDRPHSVHADPRRGEGRAAVPGDDEPAARGRLSRHRRPEDRLHGRGGPLPDRRGTPRPPHDRRRAARTRRTRGSRRSA